MASWGKRTYRRVNVVLASAALVAAIVVPAVTSAARAAAVPFNAQASADQVYVTGLAPTPR